MCFLAQQNPPRSKEESGLDQFISIIELCTTNKLATLHFQGKEALGSINE